MYEDIKRCAEQMPNAEFLSVPGMDHGQMNKNSHDVLPHPNKFLERANQKVGV
jgi:hypothetical protein